MNIQGREVFFVRLDGTVVDEKKVGIGGEDRETGETLFYEIIDSLRPVLDGKAKYQRIIIRRVFPCVKKEEHE